MASRFSIPDRLYGREAETGELLASLERVADGSAELVLLVGGSGVGKSVLVQELQGPTVERHGYLHPGQVRPVLGERTLRVADRRRHGNSSTNSSANLRNGSPPGGTRSSPPWPATRRWSGDVIPDVTLITGPLPPVAELGPTETQNRFNVVFRRFIRTFARPEHPLVVFLDDLHWADAASIRLLRTLVSDPDARHLLIIGAYRPEAVDPSGPLAAAIAALDPASVRRSNSARSASTP